MAILDIVTTPNPILKQVSLEVPEVNDEIRKIFDDMLETMINAHGAGIAAVQVGILKRLLIVDISEERDVESSGPIFMANPKILSTSVEETSYKEGCLSFPGAAAEISRPSNIAVEFLNYDGKKEEVYAKGWLARAIEHEIDHLNGIVMTDHMSKVKADFFLKKVKKIKKEHSNNA